MHKIGKDLEDWVITLLVIFLLIGVALGFVIFMGIKYIVGP